MTNNISLRILNLFMIFLLILPQIIISHQHCNFSASKTIKNRLGKFHFSATSQSPLFTTICNRAVHKLMTRCPIPIRIIPLTLVKHLAINTNKYQSLLFASKNYSPLRIPPIKSKETKITFEATPNANCDPISLLSTTIILFSTEFYNPHLHEKVILHIHISPQIRDQIFHKSETTSPMYSQNISLPQVYTIPPRPEKTFSLSHDPIIINLKIVTVYITKLLRYLFSLYQLPQPRNMHSHRSCPILQRTTPTRTLFLNPNHKKSLQGRKETPRQHQISNINSLIYSYLLLPANLIYCTLSLTLHSLSLCCTFALLTLLTTNLLPNVLNILKLAIISFLHFVTYFKHSSHTKYHIFSPNHQQLTKDPLYTQARINSQHHKHRKVPLLTSPTQTYPFKYFRTSLFIYFHTYVYCNHCLTSPPCVDTLINCYVNFLIKLNYVNGFFIIINLLLFLHYLVTLALSTLRNTVVSSLSPVHHATPTYTSSNNGHISIEPTSKHNSYTIKDNTADTNINNPNYLSTILIALMQYLTNPTLIISYLIYTVTADTLLTSTCLHCVPLHTIRHCHIPLQTKDPFTDTTAPLCTAPTHKDLPTYTISLLLPPAPNTKDLQADIPPLPSEPILMDPPTDTPGLNVHTARTNNTPSQHLVLPSMDAHLSYESPKYPMDRDTTTSSYNKNNTCTYNLNYSATYITINNTIIRDTINNTIIRDTINNTIIRDTINNTIIRDTINNTIIRDTINNTIIRDTINNTIIRDTINNTIIRDTFNNTIIWDTINNTIIRDTINNTIIRDTINNTIIRDTINNTIIRDTINNTIIRDTINNTIIRDTINNTIIRDTINNTIIRDTFTIYYNNNINNNPPSQHLVLSSLDAHLSTESLLHPMDRDTTTSLYNNNNICTHNLNYSATYIPVYYTSNNTSLLLISTITKCHQNLNQHHLHYYHQQQPETPISLIPAFSAFGPAYSSDNAGDGPTRRPTPPRTTSLHPYHTMSTTQLENLLNTTLGQICCILRSIQTTDQATLDNSNNDYDLEHLHGIIYNIYFIFYNNAPHSVIMEAVCTLVTSYICENLHITSEYNQHQILQTVRDVLEAALQNPNVRTLISTTSRRNTLPKRPSSTSRQSSLPQWKHTTRTSHPPNRTHRKKSTSSTTYSTMTTKTIRHLLTNLLNRISDIALNAQLGHITQDKTYKALEKPLLRIYKVMVSINPEATYVDIINEICEVTALHISTTIPNFSSDYAICAIRETSRAILVSATTFSIFNTQQPSNTNSLHTRTISEPLTTLLLHTPPSTTNNQLTTNDISSMKPLPTPPPPPDTSRPPTGTSREIYIKPFLPAPAANTTVLSSTCCMSTTSATITSSPPTTLTNPITTELLTTVALSTTINTDTPSQIVHPEPLVTTCSHSQHQTATTQPEPSVSSDMGMCPMKSPRKRPSSFYTSTPLFLYGLLLYSLIILLYYHLSIEQISNTSQNSIYTTTHTKLNTNIYTINLHLNNNQHLNNNLHRSDNLHFKNIINPNMNNFRLSQHYHQHSPTLHTEEVPPQHLILLHHQDLTTMKTPTITENRRRNFREARRIYEPP